MLFYCKIGSTNKSTYRTLRPAYTSDSEESDAAPSATPDDGPASSPARGQPPASAATPPPGTNLQPVLPTPGAQYSPYYGPFSYAHCRYLYHGAGRYGY